MIHPLNNFEWHDLPVSSLAFEEETIRLVVTPFNERTQRYDHYELLLTNASKLTLSIKGEVSFTVLKNLEVSSFDFKILKDRLSGELGIIPGNEGFWKIGFENASWQLNQKPG